MNFTELLKMKISSAEETPSYDEEPTKHEKETWILAIEFPDEDIKAFVMSESTLFPNSLLEFRSEEAAKRYAQQEFPGMVFYVEKKG